MRHHQAEHDVEEYTHLSVRSKRAGNACVHVPARMRVHVEYDLDHSSNIHDYDSRPTTEILF